MMPNSALQVAVTAGVLLLLTVLQNLIRTRRARRGRQVLLPLAALVYAAAACVVLCLRIEPILAFTEALPWLQGSGVLLANGLLLAGFLPVKAVLCPLLSAVWRDDKLMELTAAGFYAYDSRQKAWFLRTDRTDLRRLANALTAAAFLLAVILLGMTWSQGRVSVYWTVCFPAVPLLVLTEAAAFLRGLTPEEWAHTVQGQAADAHRVGGYYRIREIYEKIFAPQLLTAHTGGEFVARRGTEDLLQELRQSADSQDRIAARFYETYGAGEALDVDGIRAACALLHRRSVVFFNPFYRDLDPYLTLPLLDALLRGRKCLLLAGSTAVAADAVPWLTELLRRYARLRAMWRVARLTDREPDCEVGVLRFQELYDQEVLARNTAFLRETDFVVLLEPSLMLDTAQVGLSVIARETAYYGRSPVYCVCDRYTDGLVDTLSHLLHTEITNVNAMPVPRCVYTGMGWHADGDYIRQKLFDKQTRFLGNGVELAAVAIKNQVPQVTWYGEKKAPLRDIRWLAGQNYATLCRYMNLPVQQKALYDVLQFVPNLWSSRARGEEFCLVEDEFCNLFNMMRTFLSRGREQAFVNVLSEDYLLRDYMCSNQQMFCSDPNAIPSLVPAYARTDRNTLFKLLILMSIHPLSEDEVREELVLAGCPTGDILGTLNTLLTCYTTTDGSVLQLRNDTRDENGTTRSMTWYSLPRTAFDSRFSRSLKNAWYIVEDEKSGTEYIDARLFGHVSQTVLPGQFVTYDGKYYQVRTVSPGAGVILRRASDLYAGRRYYRQLRTYRLENADGPLLSVRRTMGMEIAFSRCDFTVTTGGYFDMGDPHDLRHARLVDFTGDPDEHNYDRAYKNKRILRLRLTDTDDALRYTLCVLLSEVFRTVFPTGWPYLAVVTRCPDGLTGPMSQLVYRLEGAPQGEDLYILEDSDMDLGLLDAVNANLQELLEIVTDFLDWHFVQMSAEDPQTAPPPPACGEDQVAEAGAFAVILARLRRMLDRLKPTGKKKDQPEEKPEEPTEEKPEEKTKEKPAEKAEEKPDGAPEGETQPPAEQTEEKPAEPTEPEAPDQPEKEPAVHNRYQKGCYLNFGYDGIAAGLQLKKTAEYLHGCGCGDSALYRARTRDVLEHTLLDLEAEACCDFCGRPLSGVSYERLNDGRFRCNDCSATAVNSLDEFREIFDRVLQLMEMFYGVVLTVPVQVRTADARTVNRGAGYIYRAGRGGGPRVLGYACRRGGRYSLVVENGSPRLATINTMVHELTHIWQYLNWKDARILGTYQGSDNRRTATARDIVYEGMAMWASIQYLYQIGERYYAAVQQADAMRRTDVYGVGFRLYEAQYPLVKDMSLLHSTPFLNFPPLSPDDVRSAADALCGQSS